MIKDEDLCVGAIIHVPRGAALTREKPFNFLLTTIPHLDIHDPPGPDSHDPESCMVIGWVLRMDGTRATSRKHHRSAWIDLAQSTLVSPEGEPVWMVNGTHVTGAAPAWHALPPGTDPTAQPPKPGHMWSTTPAGRHRRGVRSSRPLLRPRYRRHVRRTGPVLALLLGHRNGRRRRPRPAHPMMMIPFQSGELVSTNTSAASAVTTPRPAAAVQLGRSTSSLPARPRTGLPFRRAAPGTIGTRGYRIGVLACMTAAVLLLAGCGGDGGSGVDELTGRWSGNLPEDSMTFYDGGKVSGGATWPCSGTVRQQDNGYRLDLSCGGFGNVIMTARRSGDTLQLTDNDGAVHILRRQGAARP